MTGRSPCREQEWLATLIALRLLTIDGQIMDGSPSRGETIPIRLFLGGFDLTPTFRDVNKKFSTRYYLSLVLIDEGTSQSTTAQPSNGSWLICLPSHRAHVIKSVGLTLTIICRCTEVFQTIRNHTLPTSPRDRQRWPRRITSPAGEQDHDRASCPCLRKEARPVCLFGCLLAGKQEPEREENPTTLFLW